MHNPSHPGELLKENFGSDGLNISIAEAARRLGISRVALSRVTNCHAAISADLGCSTPGRRTQYSEVLACHAECL